MSEPESGPGWARFTADDTPETVEAKMHDAFAPLHALQQALDWRARNIGLRVPLPDDVQASVDANSPAHARKGGSCLILTYRRFEQQALIDSLQLAIDAIRRGPKDA